MPKQRVDISRLTALSMLFALTVVLMILEGMLPVVPGLLPGVKLGLSNIVVMYCLFYFGKPSAFALLGLKTFFVFLTRGFVAFTMSLAGGAFSITVMILLLALKKHPVSYIMLSIFAAVAHNVAQLAVSCAYLQSLAVLSYLPVLLISGIFMGTATGVLLRVMTPFMNRFSQNEKNLMNQGGNNVSRKM